MSLTTLTTAGVLLCLTCARTIISSLIHEYEIIIRAVSGLLAGIAVHFAATPTLSPGHGRRRHQIDDPRITTVFILLSLYALFDVLLAQHIIWGIFPYIGWTTSFVLQSSQDSGEYHHSDRRGRRSTEPSHNADTTADNQKLRHRPRNNGDAAFNESSSSSRDVRQFDAEMKAVGAKRVSTSCRGSNVGGSQYQGDSERGKVYPSEATQLRYKHRPRVGSSHAHVTFLDTASPRHPTPVYKDVAKLSGETKQVAISGNGENPNMRDAAPVEVLPTSVFLLPLTRNNIRRVSQSPKHSDNGLDRHQTALSVGNLSFHTPAESAFSDSDTDSDYTLARTTLQSGASSSTARASLDLDVEEQFNFYQGPSVTIEDMGDDLSVAEESSSDGDNDNALVLFNAARNRVAEPIELRPNLIPQDYVSQTYVRVEKFVSAVDGTELAEQIEVIPGEPQENSYDRSELRRHGRYLKDLLVYEPSETTSSTTVDLSELEGNIRAIDQRAEEHRRKGLEAKRKVSALGEKRKNALNNRRPDEAFRIKCAMQEYAKEANREDKKAAKLFFRARNRPGTSKIDVHLLRKEEALKAVEKALREVQLRGEHQLHVIVGRGIHSANGKPVLKPFLKSMFEAQKMRVYESGSNAGMLIINMI